GRAARRARPRGARRHGPRQPRRRGARSRPGQHLRPCLGDGDGVLEVRRILPVASHHGPPVAQGARLVRADVDHRLDRQHQTRAQARVRLPTAPQGGPVVGEQRVLVRPLADAVADVITDDAVAVRSDHRLDGGADVGDPVADDHRADSRLQALARHFQELVRLCRHLPDRDGARRVAVPAPYHGAMVELHQIAVQKLPLARDAVDHLVVDGDADVLGEAVQVLEGASGPALLGFALGGLVQLLEGDPRLDQLLQLLEHLVDDEPRLAHYGDLVGSLQLDAHYGFAGPVVRLSRSADTI